MPKFPFPIQLLHCTLDTPTLQTRVDMEITRFLILISAALVVGANSNYLSHPATTPTVVPVAQLREGRHVHGSSQEYLQDFPPWVNRTLLTLGQRFIRENMHGFMYSIDFTGFLLGSDARRVFISGGNTTDPSRAARRFLANALNFWYWAVADLEKPEQLFEALNLIHAVHAKMGYESNCRYKMFEKPIIPERDPRQRSRGPFPVDDVAWDALEKDLRANRPLDKLRKSRAEFPPRDGGTRIPLNQFSMANQLWSGMAYAMLAPDKMLIGRAAEDKEGIWGALHYWAFLGRGLGLEDRYNVGLQPNLAAATAYFRRMLYDYVAPRLLNGVAYEHRVFMETAIKGSSRILTFDTLPAATEAAAVRLVLYRLCIDLFAVKCPRLHRAIRPVGRMGNVAMNRVVFPASRSGAIRSAAIMGIGEVMKVQAERMYGRHFNFSGSHTTEDALARGTISMNQEILYTSNVHWKGAPKCTKHSFIN